MGQLEFIFKVQEIAGRMDVATLVAALRLWNEMKEQGK